MKRERLRKLCYASSALLAAAFVLRFGADVWQYSQMLRSTPLYWLIIVRFFEFIVPAILFFTAARLLKKYYS